MPITEAPQVDERTAYVRLLIEVIKDNPSSQAQYREAHERQVAEVTAKAARRAHMMELNKKKRGMRFPGSRPWQKAGFASRQAWLDDTERKREQPESGESEQTHTEE